MTGTQRARAAWDGLEEPWRACFELAWESCRAGSIGVGAVVVDSEGVIAARGRNRTVEREGPGGELAFTALAHAEVNALAHLPLGNYAMYTLYTSLEPCVLCTGAVLLAGIGAVRYAAADSLFDGMDSLPTLNAWVAAKWPRRDGPRTDPFAALGMLLPLVPFVFWTPDNAVIDTHRRSAPAVLRLAEELVASGELIEAARTGIDAPALVERLWSRLEAASTPQSI